jgi:hypothetical protein
MQEHNPSCISPGSLPVMSRINERGGGACTKPLLHGWPSRRRLRASVGGSMVRAAPSSSPECIAHMAEGVGRGATRWRWVSCHAPAAEDCRPTHASHRFIYLFNYLMQLVDLDFMSIKPVKCGESCHELSGDEMDFFSSRRSLQ